MTDSSQGSATAHPGLRLKSPACYDRLVWLFTLGRPQRFRSLMLRPAQLRRGETVLDVSCGTGSLALLAKEEVGPEGRVHGIDASEEMIVYARNKAKWKGLDVAFELAPAQQLPFDDTSFDVVLNTLALHHLPKPSRYEALGEMRRVLKPGGRAIIEDFGQSSKRRHGFFGLLKHRHGSVPPEEIATAMRSAGFEIFGTGPVGAKNLHFVVGRVPGASAAPVEPAASEEPISTAHSRTALLPVAAIAIVLLVLAHIVFAASMGTTIIKSTTDAEWKTVAGVTVALLIVMAAGHVALARFASRKD